MTAFVIEHDSALTAWGQVHRHLRRRIESGEFVVGARIPSEADLITFYGVSRPTIRRATGELVSEGFLASRQGAGTFVCDRPDIRCDLDIRMPWREQIVSTGHQAVSRLIDRRPGEVPPPEILAVFGDPSDAPPGSATYGRHIQSVDGVPIAVTECWFFTAASPTDLGPAAVPVVEHGFVEVGTTTAVQAELLRSFLDVPLIVVTTTSRVEATGAIVEISRTSWLASRVRLIHDRTVTLAHLDMTMLIAGD